MKAKLFSKLYAESERDMDRVELIDAFVRFQGMLKRATEDGSLDDLAPELSGGPDQINALCDTVAEVVELIEKPEARSRDK